LSILLWTDNASTLLASGINNSQTTCTVSAGQGALFPNPAAGQIFVGTFEDTSGNIEVFWCTARTGDTFTITRAQEGTTALAFASGSRVEIRCTAGMLQAMLQKNGGDTMTNTTSLTGVLALGSSGSIQGGEFTGAVRSGPGVTAGQISVSAGAGYVGTAGTPANQILTPGNIGTAIAPATSGLDLCRTGMIVFWFGALGAVPTGWHICDGTNGTPNMEDQFVVGGNGVLPTSGNYPGTTQIHFVTEPIAASHVLVTAELPVHAHPFDYSNANSNALIGNPGFGLPSAYFFQGSGTGTRVSYAGSNAGSGAGHTHALTDATGHSHVVNVPYVALFMIMKL
jgi:hypothetical protein